MAYHIPARQFAYYSKRNIVDYIMGVEYVEVIDVDGNIVRSPSRLVDRMEAIKLVGRSPQRWFAGCIFHLVVGIVLILYIEV